MAANRRALIREKLHTAVGSSEIPVVAVSAEPPALGVWVRLTNRETVEADAAGNSLLEDQHFELLLFTTADKTEEAASAALDEAIDRVIVAVEEGEWEGAEATTSNGESLSFYGAQIPAESTTIDAEQGTGVALLPGFVRYSRG